MDNELPYQTFTRLTGKQWTPETRQQAYTQYGITAPVGSAEANLALQKAMLGGTQTIPTTASATPSIGATGTPPAPTKDINLTIPQTVSSDIIAGAPTSGQVLAKSKTLADQYQDFLAQRQKQQESLLKAGTPTEQETELRQQLTDLNARAHQASLLSEERQAPMFAITGEQAAIERQKAIRGQALADQINALVDSRKVQVDTITSQMAFDKENLDALANLQKLTQPDVLKTDVNEQTGDIVAITRDPSTGEITTQTIGNIGVKAKNQYTHQGTYQNDATGQMYFYGVTPDGKIETIALPGSMGLKPSVSAIAGLSSAQQTAAFKLADDYEQASKSFFTQRDAYNRVVASAQDPSAAGDLALIFNYMKVLDPGSVVREGEFATAQSAGSIPERIYAQYNKILEGTRLSPSQRTDFVNRANKLFSSAEKQQRSVNKTFVDRSSLYGIPQEFVIRDTTAASAPAQEQIMVAPEKASIFDATTAQPTQGGYLSNLWKAITNF